MRRMRASVRMAAALSAFVLSTMACTGESPPPRPRPSAPSPVIPASVPPRPTGVDPLCRHPSPPAPGPEAPGGSVPRVIADVARQVEEVRGLEFVDPVSPEPVSQERIGDLLEEALDRSFPKEMMDRRTRAWATIGAIPQRANLHTAIRDYAGTQIIGFYDTETHQLVFSGSEQPSPYERTTLSHELTHALDDQHFDLHRLDVLEQSCRDEELAAFVALTEGSAVVFSSRWLLRNLTPEELVEFQEEATSFPPPPASVPPFLLSILISPYVQGQAFVESLLTRGGLQGVNRAFSDPPDSTEQVLHPDRYPRDEPQEVDVAELDLGAGWANLDVYEVGELWLRLLLELRLDSTAAREAATGWDGGEYRAWAHGDRVAVLLRTVWDESQEAGEFAGAMRNWLGDAPADVRQQGTTVQVLFGSDVAALQAVRTAV
jgi:hypothetical protein